MERCDLGLSAWVFGNGACVLDSDMCDHSHRGIASNMGASSVLECYFCCSLESAISIPR